MNKKGFSPIIILLVIALAGTITFSAASILSQRHNPLTQSNLQYDLKNSSQIIDATKLSQGQFAKQLVGIAQLADGSYTAYQIQDADIVQTSGVTTISVSSRLLSLNNEAVSLNAPNSIEYVTINGKPTKARVVVPAVAAIETKSGEKIYLSLSQAKIRSGQIIDSFVGQSIDTAHVIAGINDNNNHITYPVVELGGKNLNQQLASIAKQALKIIPAISLHSQPISVSQVGKPAVLAAQTDIYESLNQEFTNPYDPIFNAQSGTWSLAGQNGLTVVSPTDRQIAQVIADKINSGSLVLPQAISGISAVKSSSDKLTVVTDNSNVTLGLSLANSINSESIIDNSIDSADIKDKTITDSDISESANITDGKLAQITATNKVSGSAIQLNPNGGLTNSSGLSLLTTCSANQVLAWDGSSWACTNQTGGGGGSSIDIQENDSTITSAASFIDFLGNDFDVTNSPAGEANIALDYANSGITRANQTQTISGAWTFSTTPTITNLPNSALTNSGITVTAGTGLTGGGAVSLGGAITLNSTLGTDIDSTEITNNTILNSDINSAAAIDFSKLASLTAGYILLGNSSNVVTATALSGDVTIDSSGVTTIGANSVALGTDTTGNYVAGVTANGGLTLTGTEAGTLGLQACSDGQVLKYNSGVWACAADNSGSGSSNSFETITTPSGTSPVADSGTDTLTLTAGSGITIAGDASTDSIAIASVLGTAIDSSEITDSTIANIDIASNAGIDFSKLASLTAGNVLLGNASNVATSTTLSGDVTVDSSGVTTIGTNSVALGTDTTGNYVGGITAGTGVTVTGSGSENASVTVSIPQSIATDASPNFSSLNLTDTINQIILGTTNTTTISSVAPAANRTATIPALSGNDTFAFINQAQTLTNKTISGASNTITNIGNSSLTNSSVTINSAGILTGGGSVSLGGSLTLTATEADTLNSVAGRGASTATALTLSSTSNSITAGTLTINADAFTDLTGTGLTISGGALQTTLGTSIDSSEVTDNTLTTADLAATLAFSDGDLIDMSAINNSSATEGLIIPQATACTSATANGQICWDNDSFALYLGNGTSAVAISNPFGASIDSSEITNDTIVDADINSAAAISFSKLATLTAGNILLGNASNVATSTAMSGDVTIDSSGITTIGADKVALATDTTGNYVATLTGNSQITVTGSGSENAGVSLSIAADSIGDSQLAFDTGQNLTTASTPSFAAGTLSNTTNQLVLGTTNTTTISSIAPAANRTATLPALSGNDTFAFLDQAQTLTNKTISGASNTISNIGNSSLTNSSITVTAGTGLSGGGAVALGSSVSLSSTLGTDIDNSEIAAAAGISFSKLASLTAGNILLGNVSNVATSTAMSGDVTIDSSGVTTIGADKVALGTDTTGNYVSAATANGGLSLTGTEAGTLGLKACSDGQILKYNTGVWDCAADNSGSGSSNSFETITTTSGTSPVADSGTDTLTLTAGTGITVTGDATTDTITLASTLGTDITSSEIVDGTIANIDISSSAAIDFSKLATLTAGNILLGNASNVATSTAMSGDITIDSSGVTTIGADKVALATDTTGNYVATLTGNSQITVTGSGSENASVSLSIAADSIGDSQLAFDTGQNLTSTSTPTFGALTLNGALTLANSETISNGTDGQILFTRNTAGTVTLNAADNDANADLVVRAGGTGALTLGNASNTSITLATDSTGDGEVVLPAGSIGNTELANSSITVNTSGILTGGASVSLGGSISLTATEADTLNSVAGRGASTATALTLSSTSNAITAGTLTINGDAFTDLTGTGLNISGGTLQTTLGTAIDSSEITDNTITATDLAATLTFADGDLIDLSGINNSSTTEGLILPQTTVCTSATANGQICWDNDSFALYIGNGTSATAISNPFGASIDSSEITDGTIANIDISASAAIDFSKLATLTAGNILLGNGSNVATSTAMSGDVTIDSSGVTTIGADKVALATDTTGNYVATLTGNSQITVTGSGSENAGVSLSIAADSIGDSQLAFDTGQNLTSTSTPTFGSLTLNGALTLANSETISNGTDGQILLTRNTAGTVTLNAADNDANADLVVRAGGTGALTLGNASNTAITLATDSTGDAEVVLPANSVGNSELVNSSITINSAGILSGGASVSLGGSVTLTATEADTLNSVAGRGASTATALTLSSTSNAITAGTLTINADAFTDLTGTGLTISGGALQTTLGTAIDSSEITDDTITASDLSATLTFADGDLIDLSSINNSSTTEGLKLPQATACTSATANGQICWDNDSFVLYVGNGTTATSISNPFGASIDSSEITDGTIANIDISASAAIDFSKLATLSSGNIILGNGSNVATSTAVSGDITIDSSGVTTIGADKVALATDTTGNYVATITGDSQVSVSGSGSENAGVSISIAANSIADAQLAFNTGQHLTSTSTPTFGALTLNGALTLANSETIANGTDGQILFSRNDAGTVTLNAADNDANADLVVRAGGTGALTLGNASNTAITLATDSTGDSEVVLPANSVGNSELVNSSITINSSGILSGGASVSLGGNITLTATEADTLNSVAGRGASTATALTLSSTSNAITAGTLTINADAFTDLTGTGLTISGGALQTTLGTDITSSEIVDGTIANIDISGSAAIDFSKLATLSSGNIILGNGSNVATSTAVSGDITIDSSGVTTIGADKVALGTDTTGNYVSGATTNKGLTLSGTEGATLGLQTCGDNEILKYSTGTSTWSCATDSTGGSINSFETITTTSGTSPVADSSTDTLTLTAGSGVTVTGDNTTDTITLAATLGTDITSSEIVDGTIANIDISGSAAIDFSKLATLSSGNIILGNGSNVATSTAVSGDVTIDSSGVTTIGADKVALTTDTTGNYVQSITNGTGITGGNGGGEGSALTLAVDQSAAFAWTGLQTYTNTITDTGSQTTFDLTLGNDANTDTISAIKVAATSATTGDADVVYGVDIANLASADGTVSENAIHVGTGWDSAFMVGSTSIINGSGVLQSAGLSGTYSNALTLNSATNSITAGTLIVGSDTVTDITGTNLAVSGGSLNVSSTPTFTSETLSATTNQLVLGTTNTTTISSLAPSANRVATIPVLSGNDTFLFADQIQTLTNKTISGASNTISNIGNSSLTNSSIAIAGNTGSGNATLGNTLSILGAGINNAVYSAGAVTITGTEADTLDTVAGRGASTATALTLSSTSNAITAGTLTINSEAFTDLTGTGLTISGGALQATLGTAIDTSEITDNTITATDLNATLTFADSDLIDLSAINNSSATEGLLLPQATSCASATANGQICWDNDTFALYVGNGSTVTAITGGGGGNSFETITTSSGTSPVADSSTDTLTLTGGTGITVTGNSTTDTITLTLDQTAALTLSNTSNAFTGTIGQSTPLAGAFTTLSASSTLSANGGINTSTSNTALAFTVNGSGDYTFAADSDSQLQINLDDSSTNTGLELMRLTRTTSSTAADSIGGYLSYFIENDSGSTTEAARILANLRDANVATTPGADLTVYVERDGAGGGLIDGLTVFVDGANKWICGNSNKSSDGYDCFGFQIGSANVINFSFDSVNRFNVGYDGVATQVALYPNSTGDDMLVKTLGDQALSFDQNNDGNDLVIDTDGQVGIGTDTPANELEVLSTTSPQFRISYDTSNYTTFAVSSTGVLTLDYTGSAAGITLADFTNGGTGCSALETNGSGVLTCGTDAGGGSTAAITLHPEYPGATLTASGSATINGSLTSDIDAGGTANWRNYYSWTSSQTSLQDYTVAVRVRLPENFSTWASSNAVVVNYVTQATSTASNKLDVTIYKETDTSGDPVGQAATLASGVAGTWTSTAFDDSLLDDNSGPDWDSSAKTVVILIKMYSKDSNYVRIGDITLNYNAL